MTTVFISYAKKNASDARRLYEDIRRHGFEVWFDEVSLLPGQRWKVAIQAAIKESRYFIALISSHSTSKKGYVQKELKLAVDVLDEYPEHEIFIIPVRLDDCDILDQRLGDFHFVDLFPDYDQGLAKVLQTLSGTDSMKSQSYMEAQTVPPKEFSNKPVIQSVDLSETELSEGGEIEVTIRAKSKAPVNWFNHRLDGPISCLHGGGGTSNFHEVEPEIWETKWIHRISRWAPSGTYRFSEISVKNEAEITSDSWEAVGFVVRNNQESASPEIEFVRPSSYKIRRGGALEITVRARSNAPITWLDRVLEGPTGTLYGGGGTTRFTEIEPGAWEHKWTEPISAWAPLGTYVYSEIAVKNEGELSSEPWQNVEFTVER
ncbi:toll/interleukin-1 receptor domain-containing protein [Halomonas heilongjiangensis]|uniref:toll/interleukin-1 receptor domain-containing protein n=1 Tax=Halomonas heilongjiangensis TaxID=1387883 RepID=UPI001475E011|nr:toll/interleukin-1 receptor domain-containing protein [Halomonas heilongjiangensis]